MNMHDSAVGRNYMSAKDNIFAYVVLNSAQSSC